MSIHNEAKNGEIAKTVLLPGDPLRAKYIAETFLTNPVCYNNVRGMLGYTGFFGGKEISVQGTGMGMPSISIYVTELIEEYGVETLVRVGSCGAFSDGINLRDVILAMSACTDSGMNKIRFGGMDFAPTADFGLLRKAWEVAVQNELPVHAGPVLSSDFFYNESYLGDPFAVWKTFGVLAVEMETAALYTIAAKYRKQALSVLTVSDHILTGQKVPSDERQNSFNQMIELALQTV